MDFTEYINPELLVLIPMLLVLGKLIKSTDFIDDRYIPAILGCVGILLSVFYTLGINNSFGLTGIFTAVTQGILCAGAAVYGHQLVKQLGQNDGDDNDEE